MKWFFRLIDRVAKWWLGISDSWDPSLPIDLSDGDNERKIFEYFDGASMVSADPYVIWRGLWNDPEIDYPGDMATLAMPIGQNPDQPADALKMQMQEREEARDRIAGLIRKVFRVEEFEDGGGDPCGLTVGELFDLIEKFTIYNQEIKKKRDGSQTALQSTESES